MTLGSSKSASERTNYFCTYFSWGYELNNTLTLKLVTYVTKLKGLQEV